MLMTDDLQLFKIRFFVSVLSTYSENVNLIFDNENQSFKKLEPMTIKNFYRNVQKFVQILYSRFF